MTPLTTPILPGFDEQQTYTIRTLITAAVADGMHQGLDSYRQDNCVSHQRHTEELRHTIYGHEETAGLDERVRLLELFENRISRLTWLVVAALLTGIAGLVVALIPHIHVHS